MKKTFIKILYVLFGLVFIVGCVVIAQHKSEPASPQNVTIPSTLNKFCNCYLLTDAKFIDSITGVSQSRIPIDADVFPPTLIYLAPSQQQEALVTKDRKKLYFLTYPKRTLTLLYSAPNSLTIGNVIWTADEQHIIVPMVDPNTSTTDLVEGVTTSVIAVTVDTRQTETIIDVTASISEEKNGISVFWTSNDLKQVVYVSGNISDFSWWRWNQGKRTAIQPLISGAIYMKTTVPVTADGIKQSQILWVDSQGLHGYNLDTSSVVDYPITTWSDEPISPPSPDGKYVVYVKQIGQNQFGQFVRLNLVDKSETVLSNDSWADPSGLSQSVWSPDGTRLLINTTYPEPHTSMINTQTLSPIDVLTYPGMDPLNSPILAAVNKQ